MRDTLAYVKSLECPTGIVEARRTADMFSTLGYVTIVRAPDLVNASRRYYVVEIYTRKGN